MRRPKCPKDSEPAAITDIADIQSLVKGVSETADSDEDSDDDHRLVVKFSA